MKSICVKAIDSTIKVLSWSLKTKLSFDEENALVFFSFFFFFFFFFFLWLKNSHLA